MRVTVMSCVGASESVLSESFDLHTFMYNSKFDMHKIVEER